MSAEWDYECTLCGAEIDSMWWNGKPIQPDKCPKCWATASDVIDYRQAEENRRINAKEDY